MTYFLPASAETDDERPNSAGQPVEQMADLKVFWGPEICRLEYLVHLLDTGRIKDEYWRQTA